MKTTTMTVWQKPHNNFDVTILTIFSLLLFFFSKNKCTAVLLQLYKSVGEHLITHNQNIQISLFSFKLAIN